jgi:hypothetical protein
MALVEKTRKIKAVSVNLQVKPEYETQLSNLLKGLNDVVAEHVMGLHSQQINVNDMIDYYQEEE